MQAVAPSLWGLSSCRSTYASRSEIERGVAAFARAANGGLIVTSGGQGIRQGDLIVALAARHRLPAIYPYRSSQPAAG